MLCKMRTFCSAIQYHSTSPLFRPYVVHERVQLCMVCHAAKRFWCIFRLKSKHLFYFHNDTFVFLLYLLAVYNSDITKFLWGDLGHRPHNFLAVGAIAPMESAPIPREVCFSTDTMQRRASANIDADLILQQSFSACSDRPCMARAQYTPLMPTRLNCRVESRRRRRCVYAY